MQDRIHNFSAGPATLPLSVLQQAQSEFLNFQGEGMSVMEMRHRSKTYLAVIKEAEDHLRAVLSIPDDYGVAFLQGGASLQFSMAPMNLCLPNQGVDVVLTGIWTEKAVKEIAKVGSVRVVASSKDQNFNYIPSVSSSDFDQNGSFAYLTSNNTIYGTQWTDFPDTGALPLVVDMSSDILSRRLDFKALDLVFAGAQKNAGPSGVTVVIIKKSLLDRSSSTLPSMLNYATQIEKESMYNTPPTFSIYMLGLVLKWIQEQGGLDVIEKRNHEKAALLYDAIEKSSVFYCPIQSDSRSVMNVVFRENAHDDALEKAFVQQALEKGISGIKGHRSAGGLRASIYNALNLSSVEALVDLIENWDPKT